MRQLEALAEKIYDYFSTIYSSLNQIEASSTTRILASISCQQTDSVSLHLHVHNDLQTLSIFLGKIYQYRETEMARLDRSYRVNYSKSKTAYLVADCMAPWNGLGMKAVAAIPKLLNDSFLTMHYLARGMCTLRPVDAHEDLLSIFETEKSVADLLK